MRRKQNVPCFLFFRHREPLEFFEFFLYNVNKQNMEEFHKMKKKNNHMTGNYITAIFVFICAVAASLGVFLVEVQRSIDQNSQVTMANNVSRQSDHILSILDIHY